MTKEVLEKRIEDLSKAVSESVTHHQKLKTTLETATNMHNALVGRLEEAQAIYNHLYKGSESEGVVVPEVIEEK